jgi:PIN domain nuclease of toxin-antitoxin system
MLIVNMHEAKTHLSRLIEAVVAGLPMLHKDPFDRLLVAQPGTEGLVLLPSDRVMAGYPGSICRFGGARRRICEGFILPKVN